PPRRATSLVRWGHPVGPGDHRARCEDLARSCCPKVQGEDGPVVREERRRTPAHPGRVTVGDGVGPKRCKEHVIGRTSREHLGQDDLPLHGPSGDEADEAEDQNQDERGETAKCSGQSQYRPVGKSDDGPHGFPLMSSCCCLRGRWGPHPSPRPAITSSTNTWTTRPPACGVRPRRNSATISGNGLP